VRLTADAARERFAAARVARLATIGVDTQPHIVPIVFALDDDILYSAVDAKPKTTMSLRRLDNITAHPAVAVLADHYDDEWTQLWWVRADGAARIVEGAEAALGVGLLTARYVQYESQPPPGPVLAIQVQRWTGWSASEPVERVVGQPLDDPAGD
jgi:PPOX class probable F420-dependent enzyme